MAQTIVFSYFTFSGIAGKWFAFQNMGRGVSRFRQPADMEWLKLFGSGGNRGFGLWPNWGGYALLAAFPTEVLAKAALESDLWKAYFSRSAYAKTLLLHPLQCHGQWDGVTPFRSEGSYSPDEPVAVLTRARIRTRYLPAFWRRVASVSESIYDFPERTFSVGVGEIPIIEQATVSVWANGRAMEDYAYRSQFHAKVVKLTRQKGWFAEELFCRFSVLAQLDEKEF